MLWQTEMTINVHGYIQRNKNNHKSETSMKKEKNEMGKENVGHDRAALKSSLNIQIQKWHE